MNILAIETTGPKASVAVLTEKGLWQVDCEEQMNHLRYLMPMVSDALGQCGLGLEDIDLIAVSEGPGSFTGIRIGVSSAKALAQAIKKPVAPVPTLKSFVYHQQEEKLISCAAFDARRNQVYAGLAFWNGKEPEKLVEDGAYDAAEFLCLVKEALESCQTELARQGLSRVVIYGDGAGLLTNCLEEAGAAVSLSRLEALGFTVEAAPAGQRYQKASSVARYGRDLAKAQKLLSCYEVKPVYLRKAEAERKLEERLKEEKQRADNEKENSREPGQKADRTAGEGV